MTDKPEAKVEAMKPMTLVMQACFNWMNENYGKIIRYPGGFWFAGERWHGPSFGTKTVQALVDRGIAEYTEWKDGRNGRFPISAMLAARSIRAFEAFRNDKS